MRCIVFGGVADLFDGAVARATRTGTELGEQLDSLVDAISFGLAPALIVYYAVPLPQQGWGWAPVFIYSAAAVFRLARFNVTQAGEKKTYFIGLPSPAAGGTLATYYWFTQTTLYKETFVNDLPWREIMPILMLLLAAMMSSTVPYPAWPKIGVRSWRAVAGLLGVVAIVVGAVFFTKYFLFLFGVGYLSYGLVRALILGLFDLPNGEPRRRATDYVDPRASYGMSTDEHEAVRRRPSNDDGDRDLVSDRTSPDGVAQARRRRRRRQGRPGPSGHTPPE
jgi:CDP-diacylglycerol--serine O-phosphatidyltransferase